MRAQVSRIPMLLPLACLVLPACETGGPGSPVEPVLPTITSIEPSDAAPGDRVTIRGTGLAGEGVAVSFDGVPAQVITATANALLVVVPEVPQGAHSVTVTAGGRPSTPFRYGVAPALLPTILAIEPAGAHVGDEITITGTNFRIASPAMPRVLVGGVGASVTGLTTSSRIDVIVPVIPHGSTTVKVVREGKMSRDVPFEVLHSPPVVTSVSPNPSRPGLRITIEGRHLAGPERTLLVDGIPAAIRSQTGNTQLVATVPSVAIGTHTLQVRIEGDLSTPIPLAIDDFDATGIYDIRSEVLESRADMAGCPAPGTLREYSIELLDSRPDLTLRIGGGAPELHGSVDSAGEIRASAFTCNPLVCGFDPFYRVLGRVNRRVDTRYEIESSIVRKDPCLVKEYVTGVRR